MGQLPLALFLLIASMCFTTAIMESSFTCKEVERTALLKFKHDFIAYPFGYVTRLDSWVGGDCCSWKGVGCDNATGHVIKLDLRARDDDYTPDGEVNPSLLELKYLRYLDLSGYDFWGSKFPLLFGSMRQLQYLNLSYTYDGGEIPQNLGNLTELVALDLRSGGNMETNSLEWVFKLRNLQYLALSGINMSQAHDSLNILHHLPSLSVLSLGSCSLGNSHLLMMRNSSLSSTTLQHLDLSQNNFSGTIPNFIQNLSTIRFLDLSSNNFSGSSIPSWMGNKVELRSLSLSQNHLSGPFPHFLQNLSFLTSLDLSNNQFSSSIPSWLGNKVELRYLSLANNYLNGSFPSFVQNSSFLTSLDLSGNQFSSPIPSWLANKTHLEFLSLGDNRFNRVDGGVMNIICGLCTLKHLNLSYNQLEEEVLEPHVNFSRCRKYDLESLDMHNNNMSGQLPTIGKLLSLQELDLSRNNFETIPASFGELSSLWWVDLSRNHLNIVNQVNLASLSSLKILDISSNPLTLELSPEWLPPFQLWSLFAQNCKINSPFPKWLLSQKNMVALDLNNAGIFGPLPHNIGNAMSPLISLELAYNHINGSIPRSLCKLSYLGFLNLQKNGLSGVIPNCWASSNVYVVELSSNRLSGPIPKSLSKAANLHSLSLSNNSLEGEIPVSLGNCTSLGLLDLSTNNLHGEIPPWNGANFTSLRILMLRENRFKGIIPPQLCSLQTLQIIDLAKNNLTGTIPRCFGHFQGMGYMQNQSVVSPMVEYQPWHPFLSIGRLNAMEVFKGEDREYTTVLKLLVNIDLSCNNLAGVIPTEFTSLSFLLGLNVSHNHLTGAIPKEIGKIKSLESLDLSFNNLSGSIPESISSLDSLSTMNLSFNNLQGQIPTGRHLQTLEDPSIYMGNPRLCGDPLPKKCFGDGDAHHSTSMVDNEDEEEENKHEKMWFYLVIMLGFATGFWGVIGTLVAKKRWRHAYFLLAEDLADWLYVRVAVGIARAKGGR